MNPVKYPLEIQKLIVELCSSRTSDKFYRISKGWTNESIHKILL
jgi:hypothetical protein